jgi:di/tricarboxylate transporter
MWEGYKTYLGAAIVALAAIGMWVSSGAFDWEVLALLAGALGLAGLRSAISNIPRK